MQLKDILNRHGIDIDNTTNVATGLIINYLKSENIKIDFSKPVEELSDEEVYHIGKAVPLMDLSLPHFSTEIAEKARKVLLDMSTDRVLVKGLIGSGNIQVPYFAIYNLSEIEYEFDKNSAHAPNKMLLTNVLRDFLLRSGLSKIKRRNLMDAIFQDNQIRKEEELLVVYHLANDQNRFYYYFTNEQSDSYKLLQRFVPKEDDQDA